MLVEYYTFKNGEEKHSVEVEFDTSINTDTTEGTKYLKRIVSTAIGLPVEDFKLGNIYSK